jgi:hypothetical protein
MRPVPRSPGHTRARRPRERPCPLPKPARAYAPAQLLVTCVVLEGACAPRRRLASQHAAACGRRARWRGAAGRRAGAAHARASASNTVSQRWGYSRPLVIGPRRCARSSGTGGVCVADCARRPLNAGWWVGAPGCARRLRSGGPVAGPEEGAFIIARALLVAAGAGGGHGGRRALAPGAGAGAAVSSAFGRPKSEHRAAGGRHHGFPGVACLRGHHPRKGPGGWQVCC